MRRIWLCADDYGMAPGVNAAICDLIGKSRLNATSVMTATPGCDATAAEVLRTMAAREPGAAIGLHMTLTGPFAPLSANYRPLRDGVFPPLASMLLLALARRLDAGALAREIDAQFARFETLFGRAPDFVDGHQHVQLFPQVRDAFLDTVKRRAPRAWVRQCGRAAGAPLRDPKALLLDALSKRFKRKAAAFGLSTNPGFAGTYVFEPQADFSSIFPHFLKGLPDGGLIMCHPGFVDAALERLDPVTQLREREHAYLGGPAFPAALQEAGVALVADHLSATGAS
jgi:predicted glycoside hydrolase/deacetylase ChbG (UPF0249 family)